MYSADTEMFTYSKKHKTIGIARGFEYANCRGKGELQYQIKVSTENFQPF